MIKSPVFSLKNVGVNYRSSFSLFNKQNNFALKNISFDVFAGETLGVIGKNGAGKSTLMRVMAGIIEPDIGTIETKGATVLLLSLQVGFMPHLSGRENAILSGILLGMRKSEVVAAMPNIISFSELESFIDKPVCTYSAGMKARLGFSVAQQADPDVLLMDEVLSVGDSRFRKKSLAATKQRIGSNKTVVLISHNENTIKEYCDRVVWIKDGCSHMEGDPDTVLQAYSKSQEIIN